MVKKAFGALLLAALPLSATLVGCSDSSAAKGANPENAGSQSKMEKSCVLVFLGDDLICNIAKPLDSAAFTNAEQLAERKH
ncbi:MAG: hypothetical protein ACWM05_01405 [Corynebacterium amycolatum]